MARLINSFTLEPVVVDGLVLVAQREGVSRSALANRILAEALERDNNTKATAWVAFGLGLVSLTSFLVASQGIAMAWGV